jgi:RNA-directed DNA polymerase
MSVEQMELPLGAGGEASGIERGGEAGPTAHDRERSGADDLMERIVERSNLARAFKRVRQNQGSAGSDGMTVDELGPYLHDHWPGTREALLAGTYQPSVVRQHQIPKAGGGMRTLGIPTVLDRFIQQAVLQVLQPQFDPTFSESSFGFRPGRRAHDAVCQAQRYVQSGRRWVVDVDLEKFFDRVNHDVLMGKLQQRIADRRVLALIRRYLEAGMMVNGVVQERHDGTPQGGPLSPLLANVLLDEVDKALERRGHRFARYADDCNVYVRSKRAGERVMEALVGLYAKLRLRVNPDKSAVAKVFARQFLGLQLLGRSGPRHQTPRSTQSSEGDEGSYSGDHVPKRRSQHRAGRGAAAELSGRLARLLQAGRHAGSVYGVGAVAVSPTPGHPSQTLEARNDGLS